MNDMTIKNKLFFILILQTKLLHRNGVVRNDFLVSTISGVFERVEVCLHELLISYFIFLRKKTTTPPQDINFIICFLFFSPNF